MMLQRKQIVNEILKCKSADAVPKKLGRHVKIIRMFFGKVQVSKLSQEQRQVPNSHNSKRFPSQAKLFLLTLALKLSPKQSEKSNQQLFRRKYNLYVSHITREGMPLVQKEHKRRHNNMRRLAHWTHCHKYELERETNSMILIPKT